MDGSSFRDTEGRYAPATIIQLTRTVTAEPGEILAIIELSLHLYEAAIGNLSTIFSSPFMTATQSVSWLKDRPTIPAYSSLENRVTLVSLVSTPLMTFVPA